MEHTSAGYDVFGIWKNDSADGLSYQERMRSEWQVDERVAHTVATLRKKHRITLPDVII